MKLLSYLSQLCIGKDDSRPTSRGWGLLKDFLLCRQRGVNVGNMRPLINLFVSIIALSFLSCEETAENRKYYLSPTGDDANTGLSEKEAWKSLEKVNQHIFQAGDIILLKSGAEWKGNLHPQGNGAKGNPIKIKAYGGNERPIINIGDEGYGITLRNQSWWEIEGIEITSGLPHRLGVRRGGIMALAEGEQGSIEHIVIRDCYIHDIWGQVGGDNSGIGIYAGERVLGPQQKFGCPANDILIENNVIKRLDKVGIAVNGDSSVIVRGNKLENLGGDGIVIIGAYKALIEKNIADRTCMRSGDPDLDTGEEDWWPHTAAIWLWKNTETIMQYNEVYNTGRQIENGDGEAFDFDFECKGCILQYNYSRNNQGFLLIMDNTFGNIARYNISENDQSHLVNMFCDTAEQNLIHNNIFYVDYGTVDIDYFYGDSYGPNKGKGFRDPTKMGAHFRNNIFFANGQGRFRRVYSYGDSLNSAAYRRYNASLDIPPSAPATKFYGNCYFGPWLNGLPHDPKAILADPKFVEAGNGAFGRKSLEGYKLKEDSPCIDAGIAIIPVPDQDFYGNKLRDQKIDIGAFEWMREMNKN